MAANPMLTRGLNSWRGEINDVFPNRDKTTDGWIGNLVHQGSSSGHNPDLTGNAEFKDGDKKNEVRAIDVDKDLRNPKFTMEQLIQWLVTRARAGLYVPFRYFIFNGRIWHRKTGWKTQKYNGSNKHDKHAHFSGDWNEKADEWTGTLGLAAYVKSVTNPQPVKVAMVKIDSDLPELRQGDEDKKGRLAGFKTQNIKRAQAVLAWLAGYEGAIDGAYGPKMAAAVKKMMADDPKRSTTNGSKISGPEFARLYGLW